MTSLTHHTRLNAAARARSGDGRRDLPSSGAVTALVLLAGFGIAVGLHALVGRQSDVLRPMTETVDRP